ncbi:hypothetical protein RND81_03G068700 [Saponaria officinalis]|uniref:Alpha/beta hydrolase fold-3 domain-containing protein n=1 Tax=Saponaria officinalis TaxID=3572 RepID=A0AAW1M1R0_SAPOF
MSFEEILMKALASVKQEDVLHDYTPLLVVYKDGSIQRFFGNHSVPPSFDTVTGVESKDIIISPETGVYVRMYKPRSIQVGEKVSLLVYFHGGGFVLESASSPQYHSYLNALASKANVICVSVDYRIAPEHPLPAAYEDSWAALEWVVKGLAGDEPWLKEHVDPARVFLAGDSAGGNIAHHMAMRLGSSCDTSVKLVPRGIVMVHAYFWGTDRIGSELQKLTASERSPQGSLLDRLWKFASPGTSGSDDPMINPGMDPELGKLAAEKLLIFVAEKDLLRDRGFYYKEALLKSGWKGEVDVIETAEANHIFHLLNPASPDAAHLMDQFVAFLNSS